MQRKNVPESLKIIEELKIGIQSLWDEGRAIWFNDARAPLTKQVNI